MIFLDKNKMPDVLPDENSNKLLSLTNSALKSSSTLFLLPSDTKVDFDDFLTINFPLLKQGFIDMDNITLGENDKVVLKLNINYKWNTDLAPRYEMSIYKNHGEDTNLIYTVLRGVNDSTTGMNNLQETIIIDLQKDDTIQIKLSKYLEDTHDEILLLKNSYYSYTIL